ncbi:MAG: hypothetical protein AAF556_09365 [Pseudomonadota bacterium]
MTNDQRDPVGDAQRRRDCGTETTMQEIALIGDTEPCICKPAVIRAYEGMAASGAPERNAFEVAMRVLRYHHPEMPSDRIKITVERWLHQGEMH